jgi:hypothetical protein
VVPARKLTVADLKDVKKAMDKIISKDYPITREEVTRDEAKRRIEAIGEPFKLEILDSIRTEPITIYHIGDGGTCVPDPISSAPDKYQKRPLRSSPWPERTGGGMKIAKCCSASTPRRGRIWTTELL